MQIRVEVDGEGNLLWTACCLKTDSWLDYLAFKKDACAAKDSKNLKLYARSLRAALVFLFSHLEAVVNEILEKKNIPRLSRGTRLCDKTRDIAFEAKRSAKLPYVNFRLGKHLRDIIAHPGIEKCFRDTGDQDTRLDESDTYERLDIEVLQALEGQIIPWLDAVCSLFGVKRTEDPQRELERLTRELEKAGFKHGGVVERY